MLRMNFPVNKERRRKEAVSRNEAYGKLSVDQKIDSLNKYGFKAEKQRKKLEAMKG